MKSLLQILLTWALMIGIFLKMASSTECGHPTMTQRIVGGQSTHQGKAPWMGSLYYQGRHMCGVSVVSRNWVVTAAHCADAKNQELLSVMLGTVNLTGPSNTRVTIGVKTIIIHPRFNGDGTSGDIAAIELMTSINFTSNIYPICLPAPYQDFPNGMMCLLTGWGYTSNSDKLPEPFPLQEVDLPLVNDSGCNDMFRAKYPGFYTSGLIKSDMICAGSGKDSKDACLGDSGGPLACQVGDTWLLVGIVSWGIDCATPGLPGVYTKVSNFTNWIVEKCNLNYTFGTETTVKTPTSSTTVQTTGKTSMSSPTVSRDTSSTTLQTDAFSTTRNTSMSSPTMNHDTSSTTVQNTAFFTTRKTSTPSPTVNRDTSSTTLQTKSFSTTVQTSTFSTTRKTSTASPTMNRDTSSTTVQNTAFFTTRKTSTPSPTVNHDTSSTTLQTKSFSTTKKTSTSSPKMSRDTSSTTLQTTAFFTTRKTSMPSPTMNHDTPSTMVQTNTSTTRKTNASPTTRKTNTSTTTVNPDTFSTTSKTKTSFTLKPKLGTSTVTQQCTTNGANMRSSITTSLLIILLMISSIRDMI